MDRSVLNILDYQSDTDISLERVLSLSVLNDGEKLVVVNGVTIKKSEKFEFFNDGTLCDFNLNIVFPAVVGFFNDYNTNTISFNDTQGNPAVFMDGLGGNIYAVSQKIGDKAFKVLRIGTVDESLQDGSTVLTRQGDNKSFVFTRTEFNSDYYYISKNLELRTKETVLSPISGASINALFYNFNFQTGYVVQNAKIIYKKLI